MLEEQNIIKDVEEPIEPTSAAPKKRSGCLSFMGKFLSILFLIIISLPILFYIPFIQRLVLNVGISYAEDATGWNIEVDDIYIHFPLNPEISNLCITDSCKDSVIVAKHFKADVNVLPLLALNIEVPNATLVRGGYRMLTEDSTMTLGVRIDSCAIRNVAVDLKYQKVSVDSGLVSGGDVNLFFDPDKEKIEKPDTTETKPWHIDAKYLELRTVHYAMSMLPIIDNLDAKIGSAKLRNGVVDTGLCTVDADEFIVDTVDAEYYTPTAEYLASYIPKPEIEKVEAKPSPDWTINGKRVVLSNANGIYAVKDHTPHRGLDFEYFKGTNLGFEIENFYNKATAIRLPIKDMHGTERCGVNINHLKGLFEMDSVRMAAKDMDLLTDHSSVLLTADTEMEMFGGKNWQNAKFGADLIASLSRIDIEMLFPEYESFTKYLGSNGMANLSANINGSVANLAIDQCALQLTNCGKLSVQGNLRNILANNRAGNLALKGNFTNINGFKSVFLDKQMQNMINIPDMSIDGKVNFRGNYYATDLDVNAAGGRLSLDGNIDLNRETYNANIQLAEMPVQKIMPSLQIGTSTVSMSVSGTRYFPFVKGGKLNANVDITKLWYRDRYYTDIIADAIISDGMMDAQINSVNPALDLNATAQCTFNDNAYDYNFSGDVRDLNLQELGFIDVPCYVKGNIVSSGMLDFSRSIYDMSLCASDINANYDDLSIISPELDLAFLANSDSTHVYLKEKDLDFSFRCGKGLADLAPTFSNVGDVLLRQTKELNFDFREINAALPNFDLKIESGNENVLVDYLRQQDITYKMLNLRASKFDKVMIDGDIYGLQMDKTMLDTISINANEEDEELEFKAHIGMRKGIADQFAQTDIGGVFGTNSLNAMTIIRDRQDKVGYLLGLSLAHVDEGLRINLFPENPIIAYNRWTLNDDNFILYEANKNHFDANLALSKDNSAIKLFTEHSANHERDALNLAFENVNLRDWTQISPLFPQITGIVNANMKLTTDDTFLCMQAKGGVDNLVYNGERIGDVALDADVDFDPENGINKALAHLDVNGCRSVIASGKLANAQLNEPMDIDVSVDRLPANIVNSFIPDGFLRMDGFFNGSIKLGGTSDKMLINGWVACDSTLLSLPAFGTRLHFDNKRIDLVNSVVNIDNVGVYGANGNPATIRGKFDLSDMSRPYMNINIAGKNVQVVDSKQTSASQIFGKGFVDVNASVIGRLSSLNVDANVSVLDGTNVTYVLQQDISAITNANDNKGLVKFVQFNDTVPHDSIPVIDEMFNMNLKTKIGIMQGVICNVFLDSSGKDKIFLAPYGSLDFTMRALEDMKLIGQINVDDGNMRYNAPLIGEKIFTISPSSYVAFTGDVTNPRLGITATCQQTTPVLREDYTPQRIKFEIKANVTNTLNNMNIGLDMAAIDASSIQAEIDAMTKSQRESNAINLLLYNSYNPTGAANTDVNTSNLLYKALASQLSALTSKFVKGVDINFGVNQYTNAMSGTLSTNYTYQVSKSILDNRLRMSIGGNYDTGATNVNVAQSLFSDISIEYSLNSSGNLTFKLYNTFNNNNIYRQQVNETGVGIVLRRKLLTLRNFFNLRMLLQRFKTTKKEDETK